MEEHFFTLKVIYVLVFVANAYMVLHFLHTKLLPYICVFWWRVQMVKCPVLFDLSSVVNMLNTILELHF